MKSESSTARIKCTNDSHIYFSHTQYVRITNLEFIGCGGNQGKAVEMLLISDTKFEGKDNSETALQLIATTAQIVNSSFVSNTHGTFKVDFLFDFWQVGGAIIAINSTNDISQGKFEHNKADCGGAIYAENSAINMNGVFINANNANLLGVLFFYNSTVTTEANHFLSNSALVGGVMTVLKSTITIEASTFRSNNASRYGGVLYSSYSNITIGGSIFSENISPVGAVFMYLALKCDIEVIF